MTTATIIPLPLKMKERRAAIQQAVKDAGWIRALEAIEQAAEEKFFAHDYEAACNLIEIHQLVKDTKLGARNG